MNMKMHIVALPPSKIQNRTQTRYELRRYFGADSIESLLLILQQGQRDGYFTFDITLSPKYLVWEEDYRKVLSGETDSFRPLEPFKVRKYGFGVSDDKIRQKEPLTEREIRNVVSTLPSNMSEQYLLFTLRNLDQKKLREIVRPKKLRNDKNEEYDTLEYNGLKAMGARITYLNQPIYMSYSHKQVVRLLLKKQGGLCYKDEFMDRHASIFKHPAADYKDINATLRKLISEVRQELESVIKKDCIVSDPSEGWYLKIEP